LCSAIITFSLAGICACAPIQQPDDTKSELPPWATATFPAGYENWERFNAEPIKRPEHNETRMLYFNKVAAGRGSGEYPVGSVLVKAQYRADKGMEGPPYPLSVMRKGGGGKQNGWRFGMYDARRYMQLPFDQDLCILCHQQRAQNDYVFSKNP
jgi:hypothetical protein